ncbi:MAG: type II secretion system protein [Betaproteobacteria bacterium]|nr:type II secretion system protein [Betaproteobacteria bacterium]
MRNDWRCRQAGFSLLEIMVAFTLMALLLSVLMRVFSGGLQGVGLAGDYAQATSIAQSVMARVGADIDLKEGGSSGEVQDRYVWTVAIRPHEVVREALPGQSGAPVTDNLPVRLYEVDVSVRWTEYGVDRGLKFSTLRIGAAQ